MTSPAPHTTLDLPPGPDNPRNSEGSFLGLEDGRILYVYSHYTGDSSGDHDPAFLAGRYSTDEGRRWSAEDAVVLENEGDWNVMSVSFLRLLDGAIALFYVRKNSEEDCIPQMRISHDEGGSWSDPNPVITDREGYFVLNNDRVVQLENGRLLAPVALHRPRGEPWTNHATLLVYASDDGGKSWWASDPVPNPEGVLLQEPGLIPLADGRLLMFIRTDAGVQFFSESRDGGRRWTPVTPGNLPSPVSPASVKRIPETGDLLAVWNANDGSDPAIAGKRTPLCLAVSADEGRSWSPPRTLADNPYGWYCYTAIHFTEDQHVLLSYCCGDTRENNGLAHSCVTRVSLDWIYR